MKNIIIALALLVSSATHAFECRFNNETLNSESLLKSAIESIDDGEYSYNNLNQEAAILLWNQFGLESVDKNMYGDFANCFSPRYGKRKKDQPLCGLTETKNSKSIAKKLRKGKLYLKKMENKPPKGMISYASRVIGECFSDRNQEIDTNHIPFGYTEDNYSLLECVVALEGLKEDGTKEKRKFSKEHDHQYDAWQLVTYFDKTQNKSCKTIPTIVLAYAKKKALKKQVYQDKLLLDKKSGGTISKITGRSVHPDLWRPGSPTIAYKDFPFPKIAKGEIWVPDLFWQQQATYIPQWYTSERKQNRPKMPKDPDELIAQGKGQEAIEMYKAHLNDSKFGGAESEISFIYRDGLGGVEKNKRKEVEWLEKAAEFAPQFYYYLGRYFLNGEGGLPIDFNLTKYYWSKGLSRGCDECGYNLLIENRYGQPKRPEISLEDRFKYAVFLSDFGHGEAIDYLRQIVRDSEILEIKNFRKRAQEINGKTGPLFPAGVAFTVNENYRTGLISDHFRIIEKTIKTKKPLEAVNFVAKSANLFGRYRAHMIDKVFTNALADEEGVNSAAVKWAIEQSVEAGRLNLAYLAANNYMGNMPVYVGYGDNFRKLVLERSQGMMDYLNDVGMRFGNILHRTAFGQEESKNEIASAAYRTMLKCVNDYSSLIRRKKWSESMRFARKRNAPSGNEYAVCSNEIANSLKYSPQDETTIEYAKEANISIAQKATENAQLAENRRRTREAIRPDPNALQKGVEAMTKAIQNAGKDGKVNYRGKRTCYKTGENTERCTIQTK